MDCMKAQKLIRPYLDGQLSDRELEEFLDHVESCQECHDQLEIYFSIYQTLGDETDDGDYNFTRKLDEKIRHSRRCLGRRMVLRHLMVFFIFLAELFFLAAVSGIVTERLKTADRRREASAETETLSRQVIMETGEIIRPMEDDSKISPLPDEDTDMENKNE